MLDERGANRVAMSVQPGGSAVMVSDKDGQVLWMAP
jgi:predicted transcriptional regulator